MKLLFAGFLFFCLSDNFYPSDAPVEYVVLKENALIDTRFICLLDLVETENLSQKTMSIFKRIYLGQAPEIDQQKQITLEQIITELKYRDIQTREYIFKGHKVIVKRILSLNDIQQTKQEIETQLKLNIIMKNPGMKLSDILVSISKILPDLTKQYNVISVSQEDNKTIGTTTFKAILEDPTSREKITANGVAKIYKFTHAVCAIKDIPAFQKLNKDILIEKLVPVEDPQKVISSIQILENARTIKAIKEAEPITLDMVRLPPVIKPNQVVRVVSKYIQMDAVATQYGAIGDVIRVRAPDNKKKEFKAKVLSADTVSVDFGEEE